MRITSGNARGISLKVPRGDSTRPATDAARLAIFSSIAGIVSGANVLDIFAGTGAYGLEAISRGAASATFVERDRRTFAILKDNIESVAKSLKSAGQSAATRALNLDCLKSAKILGAEKFDIIFADPPYDMLRDAKSTEEILSFISSIANTETAIMLEAPAEFSMPSQIINETLGFSAAFDIVKRLGKNSKGKPSQIIFRITYVGT